MFQLNAAVLICGLLLTLSAAMRCIPTDGWSAAESEALMFIRFVGVTDKTISFTNENSTQFVSQFALPGCSVWELTVLVPLH